ncbi:tripartite tricarboxylate transporter substrate binding protein [Noviherbaspirillum malthae]|uniref:tripartite tricarboxylate transporter substrate binding protein n=1 Tax=Noviherbaspirillum malthae TaxID=1260987 RepID=UPI00188FB55B|nr:tripartite tricarboxylate transporter substrate binding protein [Noviherbaspirillum malthae]
MDRRSFLRNSAAAGALLAMGLQGAVAQDVYPNKPVRVIVPYSAGGGADTLCRLLFGKLAEELGQQFIVDNRGGGAGTIGALVVAKAPADGYTILYDATAFSVNPSLFPRLAYNPRKDFQPVFQAGVMPLLLLVNPTVKANNAADVIAIGKATPGGLDWASAGNGSIQHLALALFSKMSKIEVSHVPFKGGAPALNDVVAGHVKYYFSNTAAASSHVKAGSVRAVAHTGQGRLANFPALAPVSDTLPGFEAYEWNGVFVPKGTPKAIVDRLNAGLNKVIKDPGIAERLAALSIQTKQNTPAEFDAFVGAEIEKWGKVVKEANIKLD